ncbi:MAG TPA: GGDEF domain-containing protein [Baekduia sp.]|uniref:GGDEF domain-containing protein n=1 Tax=Baekduia sp. TaxID=2600305 RepID=UPI002B5EC93D|nr:GGDEF domain-containing protein [Baekduia sp.]HMJ36939.1 GGDEF domain-containing protein [Baekduia sp.]
MPESSSLSLIASLRGALEAARGVRTHDDLVGALDRVAAVLAKALGYRTVAVNLHRPEWDDFEAITVHGSADARATLLGQASSWEQWAPYIAARFEVRGAHHVPAGALTVGQGGMAVYTPPGPRSAAPGDWDPEDLLIAVLRRANGDVLGILSVDEPVHGRRPGDDDLDRLVSMAQIAALAVEQAQDGRREAAHRTALERLLSVSSRIADARSGGGVLDAVCAGIRDALRFERVAVLLAEDGGLLRPAATAGWTLHDPVFSHVAYTLAQLAPILQPVHDRHGCFLLEREEAEGLLGQQNTIYRSQSNGRGPYAWDRHWLLVPLMGRDGEPRGVIWADDPADRLLPARESLQALRLFADQAAAALDAARDFEATTHRADHDPLTGLVNRAALAERLRHALQRVKRSGSSVAVLFIDLDNFKHANDTLGHTAGDELLRVTAARIDEDLRPGDTVARFGGDEFVAICEDVSGADEAMDVAERLRTLLAEPIPLAAGVAQVTASIGVALPDRPDRSAEALLQAADRAMYEAKAAGRDAARLATPGAGWP